MHSRYPIHASLCASMPRIELFHAVVLISLVFHLHLVRRLIGPMVRQ